MIVNIKFKLIRCKPFFFAEHKKLIFHTERNLSYVMKEDSTLIIHLSFSLVFTFMVNQDVKRKIGLKMEIECVDSK